MRWQARRKRSLPPLPVARFSAAQVATLYHERWEIELGYRDIKSAMQHNAITLRSKKVDLVYQELWGLLLGYNLVRREASQAAVAHQRAPNEVSFGVCLSVHREPDGSDGGRVIASPYATEVGGVAGLHRRHVRQKNAPGHRDPGR